MIDKIEHFVATMFITVIISVFSTLTAGIIVALLFSISKEIYDRKMKKEDAEVNDIIADILGILFGIVIIFVISATQSF